MKIGVAIPTYKGHLHVLDRCLTSIENQTRKPDIVSISASSCQNLPDLTKYSFPIKFACTPLGQNAAQNRNTAASLLENDKIDILSFFDGDDEMLPTRLEFIERAFNETSSVLIVHNYVTMRSPSDASTPTLTEYELYPNSVVPTPGDVGTHFSGQLSNRNLHHGHPSVLYHIWQHNKYEEGSNFLFKEDSVFCQRIATKFRECSYIHTELSVYHQYRSTNPSP